MIYDGPRHRGGTSIDERKVQKRRFYRPGLRGSHNAMLAALKASNDALERERIAIERDQEILFIADPSNFRWIQLQHQLLFPRE